jgi:hypothetical protein
MSFPQDAVNLAISTFVGETPLANALRALARAAGAGMSGNDRLTDILFGLGTLGDARISTNQTNYSGLLDYRSLIVDEGVILTPTSGQITFVRSRGPVVFNGIYDGRAVFPSFGGLISFGSDQSSCGGGGGGGGASAFAFAQQGNNGDFGGGGNGAGFNGGSGGQPGFGGQGGNGANPAQAGGIGTSGTIGTLDPFFVATTLGQYPGVMAAITGTSPGVPGTNGGRGGDGAEIGDGHGVGGDQGHGGNGGFGGGLFVIAAPSVTFGPNAQIDLRGSDGADGTPGDNGGDAPPAGNGGSGGGGGGGAGGQGGMGGVGLVYYGTLTDHGLTIIVTPANGGLGKPGGQPGVPAGTGLAGAAGGPGANGAPGTQGFSKFTKIFS